MKKTSSCQWAKPLVCQNHVPPECAEEPRDIFGIWCVRYNTGTWVEIFMFQVNVWSNKIFLGLLGWAMLEAEGIKHYENNKRPTPLGFLQCKKPLTEHTGSARHAPATLQAKWNISNSVPLPQWQEVKSLSMVVLAEIQLIFFIPV